MIYLCVAMLSVVLTLGAEKKVNVAVGEFRTQNVPKNFTLSTALVFVLCMTLNCFSHMLREFHTCSSLIATQELDGKPWSIGTKNWRHPLQWPISSIMQIRLNIRIKTDAILRNCEGNSENFFNQFLCNFSNVHSQRTSNIWGEMIKFSFYVHLSDFSFFLTFSINISHLI